MPAFDFDREESWDYAYSERPGLGLNVSRARKPGVIDSWVPGTPDGSVYQIIVYTRGTSAHLEDVRRVLLERCDMTLQLIESAELNQTLHQAPSTGVVWLNPNVPPEPNESPSGWSLPFTWIMLVGLFIIAGLLSRSCR